MSGYRIWFKSEQKVLRAFGFRSDGVVNGTIGLKLDYDDGMEQKQIQLIFDKGSDTELLDLSLLLERAKKLLSEKQRKKLEKDVKEITEKWEKEVVEK